MEVKRQAEAVFDEIGLSASDVINMSYHEAIRQHDLPFMPRIYPTRVDATHWSKEKLEQELNDAIAEEENHTNKETKEMLRERYEVSS